VKSSGLLVGRDEEFGELCDRLDSIDVRGCAVGLVGEAGVGKSALQSAIADEARARGFTVLAARGSESSPPILIGHSFGGMIAQKLLGQDLAAAAAIAIDAAQIKGVLPVPLSALKATLPVFKNPANKHRAVSLTAEQFRFAFASAVSEKESQELYEHWTIPAPGRPLFEAAAANFSPHSPAQVATGNQNRGPLLLITGGKDNTVPESVTRATLKQYRHSEAVTDILEFEDRSHSLTIDSGWREVANACLAWLQRQSL
jgi:pimeloyl-ACP methyl ester carboxylesterase